MRVIVRKAVKFFFVFIPGLVFLYPSMLAMYVRNAYLGLADRSDLILTTDDEEFHSRALDLSVTSFWTLAFSAYVTHFH